MRVGGYGHSLARVLEEDGWVEIKSIWIAFL
jgi:hypothetical protein